MKRKVIKLTIKINEKDHVFTADGSNMASTTGLAVSCDITYGNGAIAPMSQITVYGLSMDKMLSLLRVQWNTMQSLLNTVKIEVGDQGETLKVAYEGNITQATVDANSAPDVPLIITSQMAVIENMTASEPYTTPKDEPVNVADIIMDLCGRMGYEFENNEVSKMLVNYVGEGSDLEKIKKLAIDCDFDLYIDRRLISICPKGGSRNLKIPVITPQTGLVGYPVPNIKGVSFECMYDPSVRFGSIVRIEKSIMSICNGDWRIYGMTAKLEANIPNGKWHISASATWGESKDAAIKSK